MGKVELGADFHSTNVTIDGNFNTDSYQSSGVNIGLGFISYEQSNEYRSSTEQVNVTTPIYTNLPGGISMKTGSVTNKVPVLTENVNKSQNFSAGLGIVNATLLKRTKSYTQKSSLRGRGPVKVKSSYSVGPVSKGTQMKRNSKLGKTSFRISAILGIKLDIDLGKIYHAFFGK